jgi:hypothetical protein
VRTPDRVHDVVGWRDLDAYERTPGAPYERERIKVMLTASRIDSGQ